VSSALDPVTPSLDDTLEDGPADRRFSAAVAAVTSAFGDPTRREIYLHVRTHPGVTASDVATAFSLHPNVARHHLDRLAAGGYLEVGLERAGSGAGRPSKHYRATAPPGSDPTVELFARRDPLLVSLLTGALELLGPRQAEQLAEQVGESYGRSLADRMDPSDGQRSVRSAMHAVADALTAHGFDAHTEDRGDETAVIAGSCPFGETARQYPVLCAVDRGLVRGLLAGLCGAPEHDRIPVLLSSRARGDADCAALA
jgi:predicted ArsR family transcriptional regulator